VRDK